MTEPIDAIEGLTVQESAAVAALLSAPTLAEAAQQVGMHERTLRRWLADKDHFRRALRAEQRAVLATVTARLQQVATKAVGALEAVMDDATAPHSARVTAARAVLELAHERIDLDDVTERLEALEQAQPRKGGA